MPGERWTQSPEEWQLLILKLLKLRYPVGEFIEIPDTVHGDCGIEGYGRDGKAFQCYAVEGEPLATGELTKKQKAKITQDLGKLQANAAALQIILGTTQLHYWILVVPRWEDKSVQAHAETKAAVIRQAGLPFIAPDFAPSIATGEDFLVERGKLVFAGADSLRINAPEVTDDAREDWVDTNDPLMANLDRKVLAICQGRTTEARQLRNDLVRHYLEGRNALERLGNQYPDLYEAAFRVKEDREHFLATESLIPDLLPPQKMTETLNGLRAEFATVLPGMSKFTVNQLVHEAVSDWLLRCPLDFPQHTTHDGHTAE
jgi:hypothetical protein